MRWLGHAAGAAWGWELARVYVSSTVADLKRERRAVMEWLVAAGHQPVHSYLPDSDTVRDSCLEDVDSCDLYVLILGHRYGFQPSEDNPEGLSITRLEFRRAGQSGKPRIALLRTSIPDVSLSDLADPHRLALVSAFREEVAREVRPAEFSDLRGLIQGLSTGVQAALAKRSSATGRSRALFPPPVPDVEPRGRGQVIDELAGLALAPPDHAVVVAGLGGSGKSTVARTVAARALAQDRRAWWVPAADAVQMTQLLLGLAGELGASAGQVDDALAGRLNPSDVLWQQLESTPGWLLVLDNADNPAAVTAGDRPVHSGSGWLRPSRAGLVLVTSRVGDAQRWGPITRIVRLESLDQADGAQVLLDLAPSAGNRADAEILSEQLGGLPLALHQAGSYLASPFATEVSFGQYRQALSVRFGELLGRGEEDRAKVIVTWELSLDALQAQGIGQARLLLRILSCFASAVPVPPLLLDRDVLAQLCGNTAGAEDGLSGLSSAGLISTTSSPRAGARASVKVHPLVAQTIRYRVGDALSGSLQAAVRLLSAATGKLRRDDPGQAADWLLLVPHLRTLLSSDARMPAEAEASLADAAAQISLALVWGGSYVAALAVAESGLNRGHGLAEDHKAVLALRNRRAIALRFLGRYQDAEAEVRQVLHASLRVLGPDHPDTLVARHEMARMLADQGKAADAEAEFRQVLDARLRVRGPDHPDTLSARHDIAVALAAQGKPADAEAEYRQVLDARLRVQGPDHPDTLVARHEIARMMADQGKPADAEAEYRQVLDARLRVQGPDHPDTLSTRHEMARMLAAQGKPADAEAEYRQVLDARLRVQGPDHPDTLTARHNIARALADQGRPADAEAAFRQVLDARLRVLGPDHPRTLSTRHGIAAVLADQGRPADAEAEFRQVLDARLRVLGPDHPDTLGTANWLKYLRRDNDKLLFRDLASSDALSV